MANEKSAYRIKQDAALLDPRVAAVRADARVGRGTCTTVDECFDHSELLEDLDKASITTPEAAVAWAHDLEGLIREDGLNKSSGEPDCALRRSYDEWNP